MKIKDIKKEDVINLSYKDITNILLENSKKGINTLELFTKIVELLELPKSTIDSKIADYYTSLTTDKRFVMIDGLWDLRNRHTSDKVIVKVEEDEEDEDEIDEEEVEEDEMIEEDDDGSFDSNSTTDEYSEDEDDLGDLVIIDEDEMEIDNN